MQDGYAAAIGLLELGQSAAGIQPQDLVQVEKIGLARQVFPLENGAPPWPVSRRRAHPSASSRRILERRVPRAFLNGACAESAKVKAISGIERRSLFQADQGPAR
jgi:hypothetical protein